MNFDPIGTVESGFPEKFGIPRQSGLAPAAAAVIRLRNERAMRDSLRGLEVFSHLWVLFAFQGTEWKPLVRPPRLGGARKAGVLATRSPHRPNPIGMSAVKILRVWPAAKGGPEIHIAGGDFLDGTPVLDIKPYLPYADAVAGARADWASRRPPRIPVSFTRQARAACRALESRHPGVSLLIRQVLAQDPRPAFQKVGAGSTGYSARLLDLDVHWDIARGKAVVRAIDST